MAEVSSNLHRHHQEQQPEQHQDDLYHHHHHNHHRHLNNPVVLDFDSFPSPPPNNNPSFLDDYNTTSFDFGFPETDSLGCEYDDEPNCLFYGIEEEAENEQMNFVTDLFDSRETHATDDPIWEMGSGQVEDLSFEFGFGPGLRDVGMDSESDSEEFEVNSGFIHNSDDNDNDNYGFGINNIDIIENERDEFEWEEVSEIIDRENLNLNLNSVIDRIEEITVSTDISSSEDENSGLGDNEEARNLEWEVLLAVNNLERNFEFESSEENSSNNGSEIPRVNLPEDYILTMEYDALFGQLVENENALKGSPPASKSVVENLPMVVLTKDDVGPCENSISSVVVCAVCKDEASIGEKVTKMPCGHFYHGECILPWLEIRNTCPVCRFELPTDDKDYEKRKNERVRVRGGGGVEPRLVGDFEGRYNFELLP